MSADFDTAVAENIDRVPEQFRAAIQIFTLDFTDEQKSRIMSDLPDLMAAFSSENYVKFTSILSGWGFGQYAAIVYGILDQNRDEILNAAP